MKMNRKHTFLGIFVLCLFNVGLYSIGSGCPPMPPPPAYLTCACKGKPRTSTYSDCTTQITNMVRSTCPKPNQDVVTTVRTLKNKLGALQCGQDDDACNKFVNYSQITGTHHTNTLYKIVGCLNGQSNESCPKPGKTTFNDWCKNAKTTNKTACTKINNAITYINTRLKKAIPNIQDAIEGIKCKNFTSESGCQQTKAATCGNATTLLPQYPSIGTYHAIIDCLIRTETNDTCLPKW